MTTIKKQYTNCVNFHLINCMHAMWACISNKAGFVKWKIIKAISFWHWWTVPLYATHWPQSKSIFILFWDFVVVKNKHADGIMPDDWIWKNLISNALQLKWELELIWRLNEWCNRWGPKPLKGIWSHQLIAKKNSAIMGLIR